MQAKEATAEATRDRVLIDKMMNQAGADAGGAESGFDIEAEECSSRWKAEQHPEQETMALVQVQNSIQVERESSRLCQHWRIQSSWGALDGHSRYQVMV